jgi:hypothetical protein
MECHLTRALLLCLPLLWNGTVLALPPASTPAPDSQAPSIIELPVRLSLAPLFKAAEREVPQQAGHWRSWKKTRGISTRYRAWRGPLGFRVVGNTLQVEAHVRYQVMARKTLLGAVTLKSACGVDEAPRQAIIGVRLRLGWGADWVLRPEVHIMPTRFLDRCEMTIANIDVTPLVEREFRKQLQDKLRTAMRKLAPGVDAIRQQAARNWTLLQQPVALGHNHWLLLRASGIALSPLAGHGDTLETRLAMVLHPAVVSGSRPTPGNSPLPPPALHYPRATGLQLRLAVGIDYEKLGAQMTADLAQQPITFGGRQPGIGALQITGSGEQIRLQAALTGASAGTVQLTARLIFAPETRQLQLVDLEYALETEDPLLEAQANLFHTPLRQLLEVAANQRLQQQLDTLKLRLTEVLEAFTPAGMTLDLSAMQLQAVRIELDQAGVQLHGTVSGHAALDWR